MGVQTTLVAVWRIPQEYRGTTWTRGFEIPLGYFNVDAAAAVMAITTEDLLNSLAAFEECRTFDHYAEYL